MFAGRLGCKRSPDDVGGILRDVLEGVGVKGDGVTVVNDWVDIGGGERAGAEVEGWDPSWVLTCRVGGAGGGPRESTRTATVVRRAGSWGEGVWRARGTAKRRR